MNDALYQMFAEVFGDVFTKLDEIEKRLMYEKPPGTKKAAGGDRTASLLESNF